MKPVSRHVLATTAILLAAGAAAFGLFIWSGSYNFAADDPHTAPVLALLDTMRERSIEARAKGVQTPDLGDRTHIVQGAGNYSAMCVGCHLAPGMAESELSKGLYPTPPPLSKGKVEPAHAFWVIKHGVKASGMPAWGKSMGDEDIWHMVAFLQVLPGLDQAGYQDMVAHSAGHHHGTGDGHGDEHGDEHDHEHGADANKSGPKMHTHADGSQHDHATALAGKR
jgi:mono/diheme cytochrome c family protein